MSAALTYAAPSTPSLPDAETGPDSITPDPHLLPVFTPSDVISPLAPILYLPPLLSSPPRSLAYKLPLVDSLFQPLVTETRLPDIDPASLSLHKALHKFQPLTAKYAETPYEEAFNWSELSLPDEEEREWYCVVFRSKRKTDSNSERKSASFLYLFLDGLLDSIVLYEADKLAHEEAVCNGGVSYKASLLRSIVHILQLILYWYGTPDGTTRMNLATCIWQSRRHAIAASARSHHIQAMKLAAESYEVYSLERHRLVKLRGMTGVSVLPYNGGEVGW